MKKPAWLYIRKMLRRTVKEGFPISNGYSQYQSGDGLALTFQPVPFRLITYGYKRYNLYIQENGALSNIELWIFLKAIYVSGCLSYISIGIRR